MIIQLSTDNPRVEGNAEALAKFAEANTKLEELHARIEVVREELGALMSKQKALVAEWTVAANGLAGVTEALTNVDPSAMAGTGFDVRRDRSPGTRPQAVVDVRVSLNAMPGYSDLRWKPLKGAVLYFIEGTNDPAAETGWAQAGVSTKAKFTANGATPGKLHWYRVAAANSEGQGPWSAPAMRAVR